MRSEKPKMKKEIVKANASILKSKEAIRSRHKKASININIGSYELTKT
jgi:hypothetical protein